jgi:hypothetical protein
MLIEWSLFRQENIPASAIFQHSDNSSSIQSFFSTKARIVSPHAEETIVGIGKCGDCWQISENGF